jgi:DNA-binding response OmpR family regulator
LAKDVLILIASQNNETVENITLTLNLCLPSSDYITTTGSGQKCVAIARDENPGLVIIDLNPLDTNILNVIKQIRKDSPVPIIALSTKGKESYVLPALEAGADICLDENISQLELIARVRALLRTADWNSVNMGIRRNRAAFKATTKAKLAIAKGPTSATMASSSNSLTYRRNPNIERRKMEVLPGETRVSRCFFHRA